ncbi:hypothetical protein [Streptomyces bottropensis]|uniref:hypothetical protein n=1 Tax=Streptomyces bottropensis TaxID=42235 RepID=UPI0036C926A1
MASGAGTQKTLAAALKVAAVTLGRYLSGERVAPLRLLPHLCSLLGEHVHGGEAFLTALGRQAHVVTNAAVRKVEYLQDELEELATVQQATRAELGAAQLQLNVYMAELDGMRGDREVLRERLVVAYGRLEHREERIRELSAALANARAAADAPEGGAAREPVDVVLGGIEASSRSIAAEAASDAQAAHGIKGDAVGLMAAWVRHRQSTRPSEARERAGWNAQELGAHLRDEMEIAESFLSGIEDPEQRTASEEFADIDLSRVPEGAADGWVQTMRGWIRHRESTVPRTEEALAAGFSGQYGRAAVLLDAVIDDWPLDSAETWRLWYNLAYWRGKAGDPVGALGDFQLLLSLYSWGMMSPIRQAIRHNIGLWKGESGDVDGAVEDLTALLAERERMDGPDEENTIFTRTELARWTAAAAEARPSP